jgi:hypothetical protein
MRESKWEKIIECQNVERSYRKMGDMSTKQTMRKLEILLQ